MYIKVWDVAGNVNVTHVTFTVDTINPNVWIINPTEGKTVNSASVKVTWDASDSITAVDYYRYRLDYGSWSGIYYLKHKTFTVSGNGTHTVEIKAWDEAGNTGNTSVTFIVDTETPSASITSPDGGSLTGNSYLTVEWTGSDSVTEVDTYAYKLDDIDWVNTSDTNHKFTGLSDGEHIVRIRVYDTAGNYGTDAVAFTVDTTNPVVEMVYPQPNGNSSTGDILIEWNATDATTSVYKYEYRIDGGGWNTTSERRVQVTDLLEGPHTFEVRAYDEVDNVAELSIFFHVDLHDPTISIANPEEGTNFTTAKIYVHWAASDDETGIETYRYRIDDEEWKETKKTSVIIYVPNGKHTIHVAAYDWSGRNAVDDVEISVHAEPPSVNILMVGGFTNDSEYRLAWEGAEGDPFIHHYEVRADEGAWTYVDNETTSYLFSLEEGTHTLTVNVYDRAGNAASDAVSITVDVSKPSVEVTAPKNESTVKGELEIEWEGSDAVSGIDHYEVQLDERGWADVGMNHSYQLSIDDVDEGDHVFHVKAVDKAGNAAVVVSVFVNVKKGLPISTLDLVVLLTLVILIIVTLIFWLKKKRGDR
ncbi:MAG: hypothetical protein GWN31_09195, partial [Candidatus Thorarchaeota archaeon]|nr:hypothetical protein [Candidatus Thorarchaeota archaeon]NIW14089.1 hypothetical protein [Candidatus Thorarchaeota archaeon]NIW52199.1 hypothetical protein [Candidatus Korarchaeota archaeon]